MSNKIDHSTMSTYVDGKLVKEGKQEKEQDAARYNWWLATTPSAMAKQIQGTVRFIQTHQGTRVEKLTMGSRLYGSSSAFNMIGPALAKSASSSGDSNSNRISFNLVASVIDTLTSKVAKNKIIPSFITQGGVWGMQKKAEQLSKFTEGMFYDQDVHKKGVYAFRDAGAWGTGVVAIFNDNGQPVVERVLPHELLVDELEALVGKPMQIHRVKLVDRSVFLAMYAEETDEDEAMRQAITKCAPAPYSELGGQGTAADIIMVIESYHLRSSKDSEDGLKVITVGEHSDSSEWEKDCFPYAFIHYNKRLTGFWGQSAADRLANLQGEINRCMILEQRSRWMQGSFKILVENGSKVVSQHLDNNVGTIIHYTGTPPQYITPPAINPDNATYIDSLIAKGYQQEGVSQLSASSLKPQGVDSGAALRTYDTIADDRFLFTMQEMEEFYLEVARQLIDTAKDINKGKGSYKVLFPSTSFVETIDWKDIKLKEDEYVLKAFPTSSLPDEPAGKLAMVQEYMQSGIISPRAGRRLLSMPDVEMSDKLANAAENLICHILEEMLDDDGAYRAPEPFYDLTLCKQLALEYYNYADLNNAPEDRLELLRRFMSQVDDLTGIAKGPVNPALASAPLASPTAPPVSNLLPNAPQGVK